MTMVQIPGIIRPWYVGHRRCDFIIHLEPISSKIGDYTMKVDRAIFRGVMIDQNMQLEDQWNRDFLVEPDWSAPALSAAIWVGLSQSNESYTHMKQLRYDDEEQQVADRKEGHRLFLQRGTDIYSCSQDEIIAAWPAARKRLNYLYPEVLWVEALDKVEDWSKSSLKPEHEGLII